MLFLTPLHSTHHTHKTFVAEFLLLILCPAIGFFSSCIKKQDIRFDISMVKFVLRSYPKLFTRHIKLLFTRFYSIDIKTHLTQSKNICSIAIFIARQSHWYYEWDCQAINAKCMSFEVNSQPFWKIFINAYWHELH